MTKEEILYITGDVYQNFLKWKASGVFRVSPEDNVKIRDIYFKEMGRPMPTCSNCFVESLYSLIVRANAHHAELMEKERQLEAATIATDEQPKRRRRKQFWR